MPRCKVYENIPPNCKIAWERPSGKDYTKCNVGVDYSNCQIEFRHTATKGLDVDDIYVSMEKALVYVNYLKSTPEEPEPEAFCPAEVSLALVIGSAGGAGLLLFMIGFVSYCIVINLHDKAEYDKHMKEMDELFAQGNVSESTIQNGKSKSVRFRK